MPTPADAQARIAALAERFLSKRGRPGPVASEQDLKAAGLTSLDSVNLMLAVEGEFDVFIPEAAMTPDNFRDVASIAALVLSLPVAAAA